MDLSQSDLDLIIRLISEKLGPGAKADEIRQLTDTVIDRITKLGTTKASERELLDNPALDEIAQGPIKSIAKKELIVNAFGLDCESPETRILSYISAKGIILIAVLSARIDEFRSLIMILDYTHFPGDLNQTKYDIDVICRNSGYKAIIQDSWYYIN